ncbi:hypothetical protein EXIGLDRAFT_768878 [Exidia glandulosa HHB12029]|uniref:Uncharacterized protein n=1 Tax=Exidia glandulosa HHB12029 TaxID=1314781 RepID=A0A165HWC4_EXIGL|nr:hypothetical protein EXIGLDRAFT_768878 [Exidia glandulosa HHB12029]
MFTTSPVILTAETTRVPIGTEVGQINLIPDEETRTWTPLLLEAAAEHDPLRPNMRNYVRITETMRNVVKDPFLQPPAYGDLGDVGYVQKETGIFMVLLNAFDPIGTAVDDALLSSSIRPISRKGWEQDDDWHLTEHLGRWLLHTLSADEEAEWERADQKRMVARHADAVQITTLQNGFRQYQLVCPPGWFANCAKQVVEACGAERDLCQDDILLVTGALDRPTAKLAVSQAVARVQRWFDSDDEASASE